MLRQRSKSTLSQDAGSAIDLRAAQGQPARLIFAEGPASARMSAITCVVRRVTAAEITLQLEYPQAAPAPETAVILEMVDRAAMVQCFTSVLRHTSGGVVVRTPARPHVQQRRRFPRIELFLGISVYTPDRQIAPVPAQMINISVDGAAIVLAEPLHPGAEVKLNLSALGLHPSEARATVRRCIPSPNHLWVVGVQFQWLAPEQELYLGKYIADVAAQQEV